MAKTKSASDPAPLFQLKISLRGAKPPIWRRVVVRADLPLVKFHEIIQIVMPWTDTHLHEFRVGTKRYSLPDEEFDMDSATLNESKFTLKQLVPRANSKMVYEYDFGDSWLHDIIVEKVLPPDPDVKHPICVAGVRSCPPEDCGGIHRYAGMLRLVENPDAITGPDDKEWLPGDAKQNEYELGWRNANLRKYVK